MERHPFGEILPGYENEDSENLDFVKRPNHSRE